MSRVGQSSVAGRSEPFDPFSIDDDDNNVEEETTANQTASIQRSSTAAGVLQSSPKSNSTATSKTTNTTYKRAQSPHLQQQQHLEGVPEFSVPEESAERIPTKPLPPRLNVRLTLHEEVSSTAVVNPEGESGSLSQLSIEGKVTVSFRYFRDMQMCTILIPSLFLSSTPRQELKHPMLTKTRHSAFKFRDRWHPWPTSHATTTAAFSIRRRKIL